MINDDTNLEAAETASDGSLDKANPGIEKFRADLAASKYDPEIFGNDTPAGFINSKPYPTVEDAVAVHDENIEHVRHFTGLTGGAYGEAPALQAARDFAYGTQATEEVNINPAVELADAEAKTVSGNSPDRYTPTADELAEREYWRAKETRTTALNLAARNHQGRGIPVEMLIDEAKVLAEFIETGEIPDFSY